MFVEINDQQRRGWFLSYSVRLSRGRIIVAPNTILQWTGATDAGTATDNPQRDFASSSGCSTV